MKKLLSLILLIAATACPAATTYIDTLVTTNLTVNSYSKGELMSVKEFHVNGSGPKLTFSAYGPAGNYATGWLLFDDPGSKALFQLSENLECLRDLTVDGTLNATTTILWQTNIVWSTNAYFSMVATNTPNGQPIPWLSGTNVWTGTNTFSNPVNLNSNVFVHGASGGTSNVPMGGMTFHFVNGFFTGATVP